MTTIVRTFAWLLTGCALLAGAAHAQQPALKLNSDYVLINPQPVAAGNRIEVVEFFWYGCPHCNNLQPALEAWVKRKPADVEFRRVPAIFRESWVNHARIYYTLESLGELPRLHQAVYRAIHNENENLTTAAGTAAWAQRNGIEPARWAAAYGSPEVDKKLRSSADATRGYDVPGTPSLVVDGRYLTSSGMAESMQAMIATLDGLIAMTREQRAQKK